VYENDNCHCAGTTKVEVESHGKERLKRKDLRRPQKTDIEGADVTRRADCFKYRQQQQGRPDRRR